MARKCKVFKFPAKQDVSDIEGNLKRHSSALFEAIRQVAGREAFKDIEPLLVNYRVACDLHGFADGINYMEKQKNGLAAN